MFKGAPVPLPIVHEEIEELSVSSGDDSDARRKIEKAAKKERRKTVKLEQAEMKRVQQEESRKKAEADALRVIAEAKAARAALEAEEAALAEEEAAAAEAERLADEEPIVVLDELPERKKKERAESRFTIREVSMISKIQAMFRGRKTRQLVEEQVAAIKTTLAAEDSEGAAKRRARFEAGEQEIMTKFREAMEIRTIAAFEKVLDEAEEFEDEWDDQDCTEDFEDLQQKCMDRLDFLQNMGK
jgi:colicin import membrane protein